MAVEHDEPGSGQTRRQLACKSARLGSSRPANCPSHSSVSVRYLPEDGVVICRERAQPIVPDWVDRPAFEGLSHTAPKKRGTRRHRSLLRTCHIKSARGVGDRSPWVALSVRAPAGGDRGGERAYASQAPGHSSSSDWLGSGSGRFECCKRNGLPGCTDSRSRCNRRSFAQRTQPNAHPPRRRLVRSGTTPAARSRSLTPSLDVIEPELARVRLEQDPRRSERKNGRARSPL